MIITLIIIAVTALISIAAFTNTDLVRRSDSGRQPWVAIANTTGWSRMDSSMADPQHLLFNMLTFYFLRTIYRSGSMHRTSANWATRCFTLVA